MNTGDKIGLYGKGTADVVRARADVKKAAEHAAKNFSRTKPFNCIVQPKPKEEPAGAPKMAPKVAGPPKRLGALAHPTADLLGDNPNEILDRAEGIEDISSEFNPEDVQPDGTERPSATGGA